MHRKSNSSLFQSHKFYVGLFVFLLYSTTPNLVNANVVNCTIDFNPVDSLNWVYGIYTINYCDPNAIICGPNSFIDWDTRPSTPTPCGIFNDVPAYCYYQHLYNNQVYYATAYWCTFGDCPGDMFAVERTENIYSSDSSFRPGSTSNKIRGKTILKVSDLSKINGGNNLAGCISCGKETINGEEIQLIKDPTYTGSNYYLPRCVLPDSDIYLNDDSGTFKLIDCLWPER